MHPEGEHLHVGTAVPVDRHRQVELAGVRQGGDDEQSGCPWAAAAGRPPAAARRRDTAAPADPGRCSPPDSPTAASGTAGTRCAGPATKRKIPLPASGRALSFRAAVSAAISSSRRTGSGSPSGSGTIIQPGVLPCASPGRSSWWEIVTIARWTRPCTSSPRPESNWRRPPATAANTTSLTLAWCAWATRLTGSRRPRTTASRRSVPRGG